MRKASIILALTIAACANPDTSKPVHIEHIAKPVPDVTACLTRDLSQRWRESSFTEWGYGVSQSLVVSEWAEGRRLVFADGFYSATVMPDGAGGSVIEWYSQIGPRDWITKGGTESAAGCR